MVKVAVKTLSNSGSGDITLGDDVYAVAPRADILQRVVRWQLAKRQRGTHKTKEIGEITGSRKKPWKQKGTGRARAGSMHSPHFRSGATVFGPVVRSHAHSLPKKVRALGLRMALSAKAQDKKLIIVEDLIAKSPKTQDLAKQLAKFDTKSLLIIGGEKLDDNFVKAASNIKLVDVLPVQGANVYDIMRRDTLILTKDAAQALENRLGGTAKKVAKTAKPAKPATKKADEKKTSAAKKPAVKKTTKGDK